MKMPLALRTDLVWAALTGKLVSISVGPSPVTGEHCWRFEVAQKPKLWARRNARLRAKGVKR